MGKLDDELNGNRDYSWLLTMDEGIVLCLEHLELARECHNGLKLGLHLKMASRALRHALEIYGMRLEQEKLE